MSFISVNQNPNFCDYTEMIATCIIRKLFDCISTLRNKIISNLYALLP